uniref:U650u n=1 Tax=Mycobacterium leprae TaxID=1769 RepID=Q50113_MYCLR|nr:u650u [Mycobacterium leprae]
MRWYGKAARSVAGYRLDLDISERKGLMAILALGAHTSDKLLESVADGPYRHL